MWRMIIADDEYVIRNGLKCLLDWSAMEVEIVGEAAEGEELLAKISTLRPDLVLTDIRMPGMTGLKVIAHCQGMPDAPKFIFFSGYEEFSYAKEAVRYGAVDYLLKPVAAADLERAVKKAIGQLVDHQTVNMFREEKNELQQVFWNMNDGCEYAKDELYRRFAKEELSVENCFFVGVCFSLIEDDYLKETMSYEQRGLLRFGVYNRIVEEFRSRRLGFLIKKEEHICDVMAVIPQEHREDFVNALLMPVYEKLQSQARVRLCMGVGEPVEQATQWKLSHKSAKFACELYYFEETPVILFSGLDRDYTVSFDDFNELSELAFCQITAKDGEALATIEKCLGLIREIHYGNRYAAVNRVLIFTGSLLEKLFAVHLAEGDFAARQNRLQEAIRYLPTFEAMRAWLMDDYRKMLGGIFAERGRRTTGEMVSVKNYIRKHYSEDLSLKELASVAHVSPTYFSALFKKETGVNYKSYVTGIRMEEALKLVLGTDMKTYEIAEAVGYNNVRRFVDAFKSLYRISPMDYRRREQGQGRSDDSR